MGNKSSSKTIFAYSTLGIQLAFFMVLFVYGGYKIDNYFNSSPLFVLFGAFLGMGSGLYNLMRGLKQLDKISEKERTREEDKTKWL